MVVFVVLLEFQQSNIEPLPPTSLLILLLSQLNRETKGGEVAEKIVVYQHANKEARLSIRTISLFFLTCFYLNVYLILSLHSLHRLLLFVIINVLSQSPTALR